MGREIPILMSGPLVRRWKDKAGVARSYPEDADQATNQAREQTRSRL